MNDCEHDWRVDPTRILSCNPPRRLLVCAECGESKPGPWNWGSVLSINPKDWEKA